MLREDIGGVRGDLAVVIAIKSVEQADAPCYRPQETPIYLLTFSQYGK